MADLVNQFVGSLLSAISDFLNGLFGWLSVFFNGLNVHL
jgi:hypothetical protein